MKIFDVPEAKHYCSHFQKTPGVSTLSLTDYLNGTHTFPLKEGTSPFNSYRDCALRESERLFLNAVSNYRQALDMMVPVCSSWAHVTLYYSSFFAAHSLIGIFGGWIGKKKIIEVNMSQPGKQELLLNPRPQTTYSGSHEKFWDLFYGAVSPLTAWVDPRLRFAITPVSNSVIWQTSNRNTLNYDSYYSCDMAINFQKNFDKSKFPSSLPGVLSTQFSVSEGLLLVVAKFIHDFGLVTDALNGLKPKGNRSAKLKKLVYRGRKTKILLQTNWNSTVV